MSVLPLKANIRQRIEHVCFVPEAEHGTNDFKRIPLCRLHVLVEEGNYFFRMPSEVIVPVLEAPCGALDPEQFLLIARKQIQSFLQPAITCTIDVLVFVNGPAPMLTCWQKRYRIARFFLFQNHALGLQIFLHVLQQRQHRGHDSER